MYTLYNHCTLRKFAHPNFVFYMQVGAAVLLVGAGLLTVRRGYTEVLSQVTTAGLEHLPSIPTEIKPMVTEDVITSPLMKAFVLSGDFTCWTTLPPTITWKPATQSWSKGLQAITTPSRPTRRVTRRSDGLGIQLAPSPLQVLLLARTGLGEVPAPAGLHLGRLKQDPGRKFW